MTPQQATRWQERLAAMRADAAFVAEHAERDVHRREVLPAMREFFDRFLEGQFGIWELREQYDRQTRAEWNVFGLKGLSGAMFLNTLVKHVDPPEDLEPALRRALATPQSEADARTRMRALHDAIAELIQGGTLTARQVQPTRVPFFVSTAWHVAEPDVWPAYYESMREPLTAHYSREPTVVETYLRFVEAAREVSASLGISLWELEHLCVWIQRGGGSSASTTVPPPGPAEEPRVWVAAPGRGADRWDEQRAQGVLAIGWDELGDLRTFDSLDAVRDALRAGRADGAPEPSNDARCCWDFANEMKPGDHVFAKKGQKKVVGFGVVTSEYLHDAERADYQHLRKVDWKWNGEKDISRKLPMKTLTDITGYQPVVDALRAAVGSLEQPPPPPGGGGDPDLPASNVYELADATKDLFRPAEEIARMRDLIRARKNVILAGPPGVGKTFVARRLAYLVAGLRDDRYVSLIQFHQTFAYEDFVQGYRPTAAGGFERRDGPLLEFCARASQDADHSYVLVIDEINRGNLSKIFGELLMLIEADKRDPMWKLRLAYGSKDETFYVPPNVHIIGTMNTADRSLALVDYALRRRFAFLDLAPQLEHEGFESWLVSRGCSASLVSRIRSRVKKLNAQIASDAQLGAGYAIGHSYFTAVPAGVAPDDAWYERVIDFEIEPLLREYWFDRRETADAAVADLLGDA